MEQIAQIFSNDFGNTLLRFFICVLVNWIIVDRLYYRKAHRRDFYFTFMLISVAIFFLVYFMMGMDRGKATMGVGLGLFGIFSIMRYRTDTMPVREMTYLFITIALAVVNAVSVNVSMAEVILTNLIVAAAVWVCEKRLKSNSTKLVQYDRIELITPARRQELIDDLQTRLGLNVTNVEVGAVDFLKDMAMLRITYDGKAAQEIDRLLKLKNAQLTEF